MKKWTRALYQPNRPLYGKDYVTASDEHIRLSLQAAEEGMVLLKNEDHLLPLSKGKAAAALEKGIWDTVKGGGGSGDVFSPYVRTLAEGLAAEGLQLYEPLLEYYRNDVEAQYRNGAEPGMTVESPVPFDLLKEAAAFTDTAIFAVSRFSGENWDRSGCGFRGLDDLGFVTDSELFEEKAAKIFPEGDFYLTAGEKALLEAAAEVFPNIIVVLNVGGMVDTSWIRSDSRIKAALMMWQGGMEGGTAAARLLTGVSCPSGRLPDTFAGKLTDYPSTEGFHESGWYAAYTEDIYVGYRYFETVPGAKEKVVYPFGYGLSYTTFSEEVENIRENSLGITFEVKVTNTGETAGKEVTAIYYGAPQGQLGRPARELGAFAKTKVLSPGESQVLTLTVTWEQMSAFDDLGRTAFCCRVLEKGDYHFFLGACVRDAKELDYTWQPGEDRIISKLSASLAPNALEKRMRADGTFEDLPTGPVPDMDECIFEKMKPGSDEGNAPKTRGRESWRVWEPYKKGVRPLIEVAEGKLSFEEFMAQLSDDDLICLLGGAPNTGVANTFGIGGLPEYGIPAVMTADGPAGVRIRPECGVETTAWPCGTLLAASWNEELLYEVGRAAGEELKENNLHIWLAPALNIHRSPLCGRNFEYYSEDPVIAGKTAASLVRGTQSMGVSACIKHFACNNKETNRKFSDSRVSMRALREIYLRGFEIAVKEGKPWVLMSAYNAVNGHRTSESYDLLTVILREEWGYDGVVITDWWNRAEQYKEILAGNDVKMACGYPDRVKKAMEMGALDRKDLEKCALRVLKLICRLD